MSMEGAEGAYRNPGIDVFADEFWVEPELEEAFIISESEVEAWVTRSIHAVRAAGSRGTWEGRRDIHRRDDEPKIGFRGRYNGKCKVSEEQIVQEYGELEAA